MPKIVVLGEALIDLFADSGVALHAAKSLHPSPGGAPANVAVALARLGMDVGFIGKVGVDDYGHFLIDLLASEGIDTTHFVADPNGPTMLAVVATPSPTEQQFILYNGANALLSAAELSPEYVTSAEIFIYSSVTLASESRAAVMQAVQWTKGRGRDVLFDVNLRPLVWPSMELAQQRIDASIASATIVKLNETELEFVTGLRDPYLGSQQLIDRGIRLCAVSLGADGAYFNNGTASGHVPALPVDVQDTTGSGDAFVAGLAMQISRLHKPLNTLDEADLSQMVSFANTCGALAATKIGAMSALPTLSEIRPLQNNNYTW